MKSLYYDDEFNVDYLNGIDLMSRGQHFKIDSNRVCRFWVVQNDTFPMDTFYILSITSRKMIIEYNNGGCPATYIRYKDRRVTKTKEN